MKHFIATFEIEPSPGEPQQRFLEAALERGWSATIEVPGQSERLPANTLIGKFGSLDDAHRSFDEAIAAASDMMAPGKVSIDRRFIVQRVPAGRLKAARRRWVQTNIARLNKLLRVKGPEGEVPPAATRLDPGATISNAEVVDFPRTLSSAGSRSITG